jgi:hypothetical protein
MTTMSLTTAFYAARSEIARRTIKANNDQGHEVPFLNFYDGTGPRVPDHIVEALAANIASVLNGNEPIARAVTGEGRMNWNEIRHASADTMPTSLSIRFTLDHDDQRSTLYMRPNDGTPFIDERIQSLLIGEKRDGLKAALDLLVPRAMMAPRPAAQHRPA